MSHHLARIAVIAVCVMAPSVAPGATLVHNGSRIVLTGNIVRGDDAAFAHLAATVPDGTIIILGSDGGSVPDAINIGRTIRAKKMRVLVPSRCASGCMLIFAGGVSRELVEGARLWVYCPRLVSDLSRCYAPGIDDMVNHMRAMQMPEAVITLQAHAGLEAVLVPAAALR